METEQYPRLKRTDIEFFVLMKITNDARNDKNLAEREAHWGQRSGVNLSIFVISGASCHMV